MIINPKHGFTLIELLVVVAIMGLLATLAMFAFSSSRGKARDAKRKADIAQIQKALDMYFQDNGTYPASGGATAPNGGWTNSADASWNAFKTALSPYINAPTDPLNETGGWAPGKKNFSYFSSSYGCDRKWYMLVYALEDMAGATSPGVTACDGSFFNYGGTLTVGKRGE